MLKVNLNVFILIQKVYTCLNLILGAGAVGFAAVLQGLLPELKGKKVVIPVCGGNIDTSILGRVLERALVADSRLIKLWVTISGNKPV